MKLQVGDVFIDDYEARLVVSSECVGQNEIHTILYVLGPKVTINGRIGLYKMRFEPGARPSAVWENKL